MLTNCRLPRFNLDKIKTATTASGRSCRPGCLNSELRPNASLVALFKAVRESQGLTLAEVAERMGIDPPALSRLETGMIVNPALATLHKWAEAVGRKLDFGLSVA